MSFGVSGWKSDARYWMWPRPGPSSVWPPPYARTPSRSHQSYISNRLLSGPKRDGLMFTMRGLQGRSSTSATEWIGASQVTRSLTGVEDRARLVRDVGVLEPGVRERLDHHAVQLRIGLDVDRRALVLALEVERVDRAGGHQLRPPARGVQLLVGSSFSFVPG